MLIGGALHRPVLVVAIVAAAIRLAALAHVPLVVTNDGVGYAGWAIGILGGDFPDLPIFRTPGYPLFLAALFAVGGVGAVPVLIAHHALGVAACAMIAAASRRLAGPGAGLVCGLLAAADARLLGIECYLLTEALATFLLVLALWLALGRRRPRVRGACLGAALASLCLVRPAFQIAVPFLAAGFVLTAGRRGRPVASATLLVVVGGTLLAPWLVHNHARGVNGLSGANSVFLWIGAHQTGVIDGAVPPPDALRGPYERLLAGKPRDGDDVYPFLAQAGAWSDAAARREFSAWTAAALRARPGAYAWSAVRAALWQLDLDPGTAGSGELRWYLRRLAGPLRPRPGSPNFQFNMPDAAMERFAMHDDPGLSARAIGVWGGSVVSGLINGALFVLALSAGLLCLWRRRWGWACVLGATGAYFAAHVLMLLPYSRFSLPVWISWYMAPAMLLALRREGHGVGAAANSSGDLQKNSSRPGGREP